MKRALLISIILLAGLLTAGCGGGSFSSVGLKSGEVRISVIYPQDAKQMTNSQQSASRVISVARYTINAYSTTAVTPPVTDPSQVKDIAPLVPEVPITYPETRGVIRDVPVGSTVFVIAGYDANGSLVYFGSLVLDVKAGVNNPTDFDLSPYNPIQNSVSGKILNIVTGSPIAGASVTIGTQNTTTGADGSYQLANVPPGNQNILITASGYMTFKDIRLVGPGVFTMNLLMTPELALVSVTNTPGNQQEADDNVLYERNPPIYSAHHVSAGGRFVVYVTRARNLTDSGVLTPATNYQVYRYDRITGVTSIVSINDSGQVGNGDSWQPFISNDGRFIVFSSSSTNFPGARAGVTNIYLRDMDTARTELVSHVDGDVTNSASGDCFDPSVNADGSVIAFASSAPNLPNYNAIRQIYVTNRTSHSVKIASMTWNNVPGNGDCSHPVIAQHRNIVVFESSATDFYSVPDEGMRDIYARDLDTSETLIVSAPNRTFVPLASAETHVLNPSVSDDGNYVVFETRNDLFNPFNPPSPGMQVYMRDLTVTSAGVDTIKLISHMQGTPNAFSNGNNNYPAISGDGRRVVFVSTSGDIIPAVGDGIAAELFMSDLGAGQMHHLTPYSTPLASVEHPSISTDGGFISFTSLTPYAAPASGARTQLFLKFFP